METENQQILLKLGIHQLLAVSLLATVAALVAGCSSGPSKAELKEQAAYLAGQNQELRATQDQNPPVRFRGEVRQQVVPWTKDLTLSRAIVAAGYYGFTDPRKIVITRGQEKFEVNPKRLLQGLEDPPLAPGDEVEFIR